MASMPQEAMQTPNVPPSTISRAGMFMKATGVVPSIIAPPSRPTTATTIPMAVAAFMDVQTSRSAGNSRSSPRSEMVGRVGTRVGAGKDAGAPLAHRGDDRVDALVHHDLGPGGERDRGVGRRLDGHDQVRVQMEGRVLGAQAVQLDHGSVP